MDESDAMHASELFMFDLGSPSKSHYPFIERLGLPGRIPAIVATQQL
jgi:hypothetical protein